MDVYERILELERDGGWFSLSHKGVAWWNLLRYPLISDILLEGGLAGQQPDSAARAGKKIPMAAVGAALHDIRERFSGQKADLLLHGMDEKLSFCFDDFRAERGLSLARSSLAPLSAYTAGYPPRGITSALATFLYFPKRLASLLGQRLRPPEIQGLPQVLAQLEALTGKKLDTARYTRQVAQECLVYRHYHRYYQRLLRGRFTVAVTGNHYSTETFALTRAAQSLGMPVLELQHGVTGARHAAYNILPETRGEIYFPDVLLSFGSYWNSVTRTPPGCKAIAAGFPWYERSVEGYSGGGEKDDTGVVFYSQGSVCREMAAFALAFHRLGTGKRVLLKLHPGEAKSWRERTPELENSGVEVLDSPMNVYELLGRYRYHVGAYSTVIYEALAFGGNRVFVVKPISYGYADTLMEQGYVAGVETPEGLAQGLRENAAAVAGEAQTAIFRPNAAQNIYNVLEETIRGVNQGDR